MNDTTIESPAPRRTLDERAGDLASNDRLRREWHVLYVKSRQEKALADDLAAMRVEHYLPLVRQARLYGKRRSFVEIPLFPGYLFLHGEIEDAFAADRTGRVSRLIRVSDQRQLGWELKNLQLALSSGATLLPHAYLKRGTRVEVRSGPFRGLQGVVEDSTRLHRLVLQVETLACAVSFEIDATLVDPVN